MKYEMVIGLEIHAELNTRTKIFCSCSTQYGAEPNTQVCPICLAMPGTLPVLNRQAVEKCVIAGLALGCDIATESHMDRKNYFYPDLPKAYQISQLFRPLCTGGALEFEYEDEAGQARIGRVRINRIHLEEDAGKSMHDLYGALTLLDFNRGGVPLIEIVTEPDIRSPEEAGAFVDQLRLILRYAGVSDCQMQEGSLRADINLSVRPAGSDTLGTRTEIKNLNSIRAIVRAARAEFLRQTEVLEDGGEVVQETRRWDDAKGRSLRMRTKEEANDYRYFPDPDLLPIRVDADWLRAIRDALPELPGSKRRRYVDEYGLPGYDAGLLTSDPAISAFFEDAVACGADAKAVSNFIMGDMMRIVRERELDFAALPFSPANLATLVNRVAEGVVSISAAKGAVLDRMFETGENPDAVIQRMGLRQVSDEDTLRAIVRDVIRDNPGPVQQYRDGKTKVLGFLMGQVMKQSRGKAQPAAASQLLREELEK